MVEIVFSVAAKVAEYLVDPVVRQFGYFFNYHANIGGLSQQVERLRGARARHQHSVDEALRNGHMIEDDVRKWFTRADEFIADTSNFLEDENKAQKSCFKGLCPNLKSRYQLSREAKKKTEIAAQIQGDAGFERVSYRAPLQEIRHALSSDQALPSRVRALNEVIEALKDANINTVGVWGLPGVGKTTLVKQVAKQMEQGKLFDMVVMAPVFQTPDYKEIQQQLADKLGLKFEELSEQGRAARLHQRMNQENSILVILDDLWAQLDLEKIGIPSPDHQKGCKLLLASRNKEVLSNEMGTQMDFRVQLLEEEESWILFKSIAGDSIEEPDLKPIAIEVARQCANLPIAIVTMATALKNKSLSIWKDALQQLRMPTSTNISGLESKVYLSLKLSYDYLGGEDVKSLFLLCGLFSKYIPIRELLKFGVGLRLFKGTGTLEEARNRLDALVDKLKASNLLLDTGYNAFVTMHDLVRIVAIEIAFEQHHEYIVFQKVASFGVEKWPKMDELQKLVVVREVEVRELPRELICPKLQFFGYYGLSNNLEEKNIPDAFFEGMKQLNVLALNAVNLASLPSSLRCLANLRTMCLDWCKLGGITIIAELRNLEILSLAYTDIEELPREIAGLSRLRLLDLGGCSELKLIPPGLISGLLQLENLWMGNSFTQWDMEGRSNASLAELKHLSKLSSLDIQISDAKLLLESISLFDKLERYRIFVGDIWGWGGNFRTDRTLKLYKVDTSLSDHHVVVDRISKLVKRSEDVHLRELCVGINSVSKLGGGGFLKLYHLKVGSSPEIEYVVNVMDLSGTPPSHGAFPVLKTLSLYQLVNLQQICHGPLPAGSFSHLASLRVEDCDGLKYLFSASMARGLPRLEEISVSRCKSMDEMVCQSWEDAVKFPELKHLKLSYLPELKSICKLGNIIFPKLATCFLESLPALTSFSLQSSTPVLFGEWVAFPCLKVLHITGLDNVKRIWDNRLPDQQSFCKLIHVVVKSCRELWNIFPSNMLKRLQSLEILMVEDCVSLREVFDVEGMNANVKESRVTTVRIPMSKLLIESLPEVKTIWNKELHGISLTFQDLNSIIVNKCQSLKYLFPASLVKDLEQLQVLCVVSCGIEEIVAKGVETELEAEFVFPKLTFLQLDTLPQLSRFYPGPHTSQWPLLKQLTVMECGRANVFGFETPTTFQPLMHDHMPLFSIQQVGFPYLEEVALYQNKGTELWLKQSSKNCFPRLKVLSVQHYGDISVVIPSFMLGGLHGLEELLVVSCSSVKEVFQLDDENHSMRLLCLRTLRLLHLPSLTHLWKENSQPAGPTFEYLQILVVWDCGSLMNLVPSSVSFRNLSTLEVMSCGRLKSLMSPSVAKTLIALRRLLIAESDVMEEVVFNEGSGEATDEITFPELKEMFLVDLPNLASFVSGGYVFLFPSLERLYLKNCPKMSFSPRSLTAPNLKPVVVNDTLASR